MDQVSVVIPVKDEPYIGTLVDQIHQILNSQPHEILVVYGDTSKTIPDVRNAKTFKVFGDSLETAILFGFAVAKGSIIVVMDGDGSHPPQVIPKLLAGLDSADLVIASRLLTGNPLKMSPYRSLVTKIFAQLGRATGANSTDPMSGFFAFHKDLLDGISFKPFKWKVLYEILKKKGGEIQVEEIPYAFEKRRFGSTKTSTRMGLAILWNIFSASSRLRFASRILLTVGIVCGLLYYLNIGELGKVFLSIKPQYLLLSILAYILMSSIMALRLDNVLNIFGKIKKTFKDVYWAHTLGMLTSNLTPAKIGYLASVPVLSARTGLEKRGCLSAVVGIQSVELLVKALLGLFSLIIVVSFSSSLELLFPAMIGILAIVILGSVGLALLLLKPYWLEDVPLLGDVAGYLVNYPQFKSKFGLIVVCSILCWIFRGVEWTFLGMALGIDIPFYIFLILHPLLTAVRFLPLTPSSLGVFEFALIWGFAGFGISPEVGFAFGLLDRIDNLPDFLAVKELLKEGVVF